MSGYCLLALHNGIVRCYGGPAINQHCRRWPTIRPMPGQRLTSPAVDSDLARPNVCLRRRPSANVTLRSHTFCINTLSLCIKSSARSVHKPVDLENRCTYRSVKPYFYSEYDGIYLWRGSKAGPLATWPWRPRCWAGWSTLTMTSVSAGASGWTPASRPTRIWGRKSDSSSPRPAISQLIGKVGIFSYVI